MGSRPKTLYVRSETYRRFCASLACFVCGIEGQSNACHPNSSRFGKGRSIKAGDQYVFPLCVRHHREHDQCLEMTKDERDELEDSYILKMQAITADAEWVDGQRAK